MIRFLSNCLLEDLLRYLDTIDVTVSFGRNIAPIQWIRQVNVSGISSVSIASTVH